MDIRELKYFKQVVECASYSIAAEKLYISQPALSKMIKKLEAELGVPLFDIRTNGVYLTDYGQQLYQRAVPLLAEFDSLSNFVKESQARPTGKLRIGVTPMLATLYMVDIITEFSRHWPEIELQIIEDGSIALRKTLLNGDLDMVLCITGDEVAGLQDTILFEDEMVVVVSVENALSSQSSIRFEQLEGQLFNLYSQYASLSRQITERCVKSGFIPKINISSSKVNFMLQMTEHNRGICILPRPYALRGLRANLKMIPFAEKFPWQGCIVSNQKRYKPNVAQIFEKFVLDYFRSYRAGSQQAGETESDF